jgi:hypothetical protein
MPACPDRVCAIFAVICLHFGGDLAHADAEAKPVVIRYLNDRGYVPPHEIAEALGFFKGRAFASNPRGIHQAGRKVWPRWRQARSTSQVPLPLQ